MIVCKLSVLMGKKKIMSFRQLEQATGVHRYQLARLYDDEWERIEKWQIEALCTFFECDVSDLFTVE